MYETGMMNMDTSIDTICYSSFHLVSKSDHKAPLNLTLFFMMAEP